MTKDNFRELCEQVLIPRLGDLLYAQFVDMQQTLDMQSSELIRIGKRLDIIERHLARHNAHEKAD
jgi:hypothetical protein